MKPPTTRKVVCNFMGLVTYYHDKWATQSHTLESLTKLTPNKVKFKWNEVKQKNQIN